MRTHDKKKMVDRALVLCRLLHGDQKRKYNPTPYFWHPVRVAKILTRAGIHNPYVISAALLHDVVEDTACTLEDLEKLMGRGIAYQVSCLTDPVYPADVRPNRATRKNFVRFKLSKAEPEIQSIKLADLYDNCKSILKNDPNFSKVFMKEYEALFETLVDADPKIRLLCDKQLNDYFRTEEVYNG